MPNRRRSDYPAAPPWLHQLRDSLPAGEPGEVVIPTRDGVAHLTVSRQDVDEMLVAQQRVLGRQKFRFSLVVGVISACLVGFIGYSQDLGQQKMRLSDELATAQADASELNSALDEMFSTARGVASGVAAPELDTPLEGLQTVGTLLEDLDEAFTVYTDITRQAVSRYQEDLSLDLAALDVDSSFILQSETVNPVSWGGGVSGADAPGRLLATYLPGDLARALRAVSVKEGYRSTLPDLNPMQGGRMTSGFGMREHPVTGQYVAHRGVDLVSWDDQRVRSAGEGRVVFADYDGASGNRVTIDHGFGIETIYAHLARIDVEEGQWVKRGEWIGLMGDTGLTDGAHLHYEVRLDDRHVDPLEVFRVARDVQ